MDHLILSVAFSVLPSIVILSITILRSDRRRLVVASFITGYISTIPALLIILAFSISMDHVTVGQHLLRSFVLAGVIEEGAKLLGIHFILRRDGDSITSRLLVTISMSAAAGFATFENLLYAGVPLTTLILRGGTAMPLHIAVAVIMTSIAYRKGRPSHAYIMALIVGALLHGVYDFLLGFGQPVNFFALGVLGAVVLLAYHRANT